MTLDMLLIGSTSLWADLPAWSLIFSGPLVWVKIEVSSLAPEHVIKTWQTLVPNRATDGLKITDRTPPFEPSWSTVFDRIVASSSYVASFFTDVTGLVMCSIWKDHPMTSIFVFYALKFLWWITELPLIKKSFISCIDMSLLPSFSGEWWSERTWSRLCASSSLKLQSCPEVARNQSDTCSYRIHNCLDMMWIWYISLSLSESELIEEKFKLVGKIIRRWINRINNSTIPFILMWSRWGVNQI
jgi:hypothetical protein